MTKSLLQSGISLLLVLLCAVRVSAAGAAYQFSGTALDDLRTMLEQSNVLRGHPLREDVVNGRVGPKGPMVISSLRIPKLQETEPDPLEIEIGRTTTAEIDTRPLERALRDELVNAWESLQRVRILVESYGAETVPEARRTIGGQIKDAIGAAPASVQQHLRLRAGQVLAMVRPEEAELVALVKGSSRHLRLQSNVGLGDLLKHRANSEASGWYTASLQGGQVVAGEFRAAASGSPFSFAMPGQEPYDRWMVDGVAVDVGWTADAMYVFVPALDRGHVVALASERACCREASCKSRRASLGSLACAANSLRRLFCR